MQNWNYSGQDRNSPRFFFSVEVGVKEAHGFLSAGMLTTPDSKTMSKCDGELWGLINGNGIVGPEIKSAETNGTTRIMNTLKFNTVINQHFLSLS